MPPIAMLIPGVLWLFEHVVAPIAEEHLPTLTAKLGALAATSGASDIISTIEGVVGKVEDSKLAALQAQISLLLEQAKINEVEAASASMFIAGARPFLFWGLSILLLVHLTLWNVIDALNSLVGTHITQIGQIDPITLSLLSAILGIGIVSRTAEKIGAVARNSMDD